MTSMSMDDLESRRGWVVFAAIVMFSVGCFRIISGISYLANSHKINDFTLGLFGDNMTSNQDRRKGGRIASW